MFSVNGNISVLQQRFFRESDILYRPHGRRALQADVCGVPVCHHVHVTHSYNDRVLLQGCTCTVGQHQTTVQAHAI